MDIDNLLMAKIAETQILLDHLRNAINASTIELNNIVNHLNQKDEN